MSGEVEVPVHHPVATMTKLIHSSGGSTGEESSGEDAVVSGPLKKIRSNISISMCMEQGEGEDEGKDASNSGENSDAEGDEGLESHHSKEDLNKKMFECDLCNMLFSNSANMRRHRMRHSGIKPFQCKVPECQKRFFRKDHLAEHMATHSKLLPFRCPICNKGFQRQIAMRAHFQNEHVGGSQDVVKACPLCAYKAGSMKSLRVHFYSRHGIDLDNPMPNSPYPVEKGSSSGSGGGEYSQLAQALGFDDREKSNGEVPSHFLVPQIEISSNSSMYPFHLNADSSYSFSQDEKGGANVSPQSDSSITPTTSSDLVKILVKKETCTEDADGPGNEDQEMPEDLSAGSSSYRSPEGSPKCSSSSKLSPLKSLLREEWRPQETTTTANGGGSSLTIPRERSDSSSGHSSNSTFHNQSCDGEAITSSNNGPDTGAPGSLYGRRGVPFPALHQCVYCGIIFPDKTLYFLHKGCHSEMNPWRCNICGELCNDVYDFNSHLLSKSHQ